MKEEIKALNNHTQWLWNTGDQRRVEQKKERKTKTRKGEIIKNTVKHFTMFYQNIKGIKSKVDSLTETLDDKNPTIICIVEAKCSKKNR